MILLATGLSAIEEELLKEADAQRCYNLDILVDVAREVQPDAVVISPYLPGEEDLFRVVLLLRSMGKRVIFLPGDPRLKDAQDWMIRLIPYGVYDYVYDPVTAGAVQKRINNPATLGDIPQTIVRAAGEDGTDFARDIVASIQPKEPPGVLGLLKSRINNFKRSKKTDFQAEQPRAPEKQPHMPNERIDEEKIPPVRITSAPAAHFLFISPWQDGAGVSEIVFSLNAALKWSVIDANCKRPALSRLMEVPERDRWQYDWRSFGHKALIRDKDRVIGLLDPNLRSPCGEHALSEIAAAITPPALWDCGSDPDGMVFQKMLPGAHVMIVADAAQPIDALPMLLEMVRENRWEVIINNSGEGMESEVLRITGKLPLAMYPRVTGKPEYKKWVEQEKIVRQFMTGKGW